MRSAAASHPESRLPARFPARAPRVRGRGQTAVAALAAILLVLLYAPTLAWLWGRWTENVWEHAHGLLVVPLVLYFAYEALRPFAERPAASSAWGFALLVPGLALHVLDTGMHTQLLSGASMLLVLQGLSLLALGVDRARAVAFPLALLAFALPIPLAFTDPVHLALRRFVTAAMGWLLPLIGISVFTEGTTILMPRGALEIADACSGFTTLYAAGAVALLTAYTAAGLGQRVLVLAAAVPLAIAANLLRVAILAALVTWSGPGILDTFVHPLSGLMTFALALPIIFWLGGERRPWARAEQPA